MLFYKAVASRYHTLDFQDHPLSQVQKAADGAAVSVLFDIYGTK